MKAGPVWRAMANPTRRRLIELLRESPRTTGELCRAFSTTRFAVMKHLGILEQCGVVTVRRAGRERWNSLNPDPFRALDRRWAVEGSPARQEQEQQPVTIAVFIGTAPWRVFDALTVNIAAWWGAPHLVAADASNLILEPQPGGRFLEEWGHRQGVLRGVVTAVRQDERLDVEGAIFGASQSALRFTLDRCEDGTRLTATLDRASGTPGTCDHDRDILDDLIRTRLKAFVEHGTRSGLVW